MFHFYPPFLLLIARYKKNGAPKNDVTTPIGISTGAIMVLPIVSQKSRKTPPPMEARGISLVLLLLLVRSLIVCGTISPTKPIIPVNATENPTINEAITSILFFSFSTLTPKACASSSPLRSRSSSCLLAK